ncbi:MAG: hypothetical protein WBX15_09350 [Thermoanaerobaculia bacterium]
MKREKNAEKEEGNRIEERRSGGDRRKPRSATSRKRHSFREDPNSFGERDDPC